MSPCIVRRIDSIFGRARVNTRRTQQHRKPRGYAVSLPLINSLVSGDQWSRGARSLELDNLPCLRCWGVLSPAYDSVL